MTIFLLQYFIFIYTCIISRIQCHQYEAIYITCVQHLHVN